MAAGLNGATPSNRPVVAIIGAGFSGVITAIHLLRGADPPVVRLIERGEQFALGAAYSTVSTHHLLNVRASNMSAFDDQPEHFVDWLRRDQSVDAGPTDFVTRSTYGRYLRSLLKGAMEKAACARLLLDKDEAVSLTREKGRWTIGLAMGRKIAADAVVLAPGNQPPRQVPGLADAEDGGLAAADPIYVADPWRIDKSTLPKRGQILLLGSGLTAVDVALDLLDAAPGLNIMALSRHGLLPRRHTREIFQPHRVDVEGNSVAALLASVRKAAREADWRAVIDGVRIDVQRVWRAWSDVERRRYLRHLRSWWGVHRHRLSPQVAERVDGLIADRTLVVAGGRLVQLEAAAEGAIAVWTPRGETAPTRTPVALVVNCTGPNERIGRTSDPLLQYLHDGGLIRPDAYDLGADVDAQARMISATGTATPQLYAVGPIARGAFWEVTSVPDIRVQARIAAEAVLADLATGAAVIRAVA